MFTERVRNAFAKCDYENYGVDQDKLFLKLSIIKKHPRYVHLQTPVSTRLFSANNIKTFLREIWRTRQSLTLKKPNNWNAIL
jgi:hypothetical protein